MTLWHRQNRDALSLTRLTALVLLSLTGLCVLQNLLRGSILPDGDTIIRLLPSTEWGIGPRADVPVPLALPPEVLQGKARHCRFIAIGLPPPMVAQKISAHFFTAGIKGIGIARTTPVRGEQDTIPLFYSFIPRKRGGRFVFRPTHGAKLPQPSLATVFPVPPVPMRRFRFHLRNGESISSGTAAKLSRIGKGMRLGIIEVVQAQSLKVEPVF